MILCILQARMSSTRLPGKVLLPLLGVPMIGRQIERIKQAKSIDKLIVATSEHHTDDALVEYCKSQNVTVFRGSLDDVCDRFYQAAKPEHAEIVIRLTGDCPLSDPLLIDEMVATFKKAGVDYLSNTVQPSYPDGFDVEIFTYAALEKTWQAAKKPSEREHVTPYIYTHPDLFKIKNHLSPQDMSMMRLTVDEKEDYEIVQKIYEELYSSNARFGLKEILFYLEKNPMLLNQNKKFKRNEGYKKSLQNDESIGV